MGWPVPGTLMVEPTESENVRELTRFCEAMIQIRKEISEIEQGQMPRDDNLLKNAPHTLLTVMKSEWKHPYSRERAVFPVSTLERDKFWPLVARLDDVYGDANLQCTACSISAQHV